MSENPQQRPPKGLLRAGRALWRDVQSKYVLDPAELAVLLQMCRLGDQLERLQDEFSGQNAATVKGSRGQPVLNPLLGEIRLTSLALAKLAAALDLPQPKSSGAGNRRRGRLQSVGDFTRKAGA
jgi:hypothetical protein